LAFIIHIREYSSPKKENEKSIQAEDIIITPRIGVDYAAEDASLPYRFELKTKTF
jgi:3-methyladenine DNA glycosylase Mpg